MSAPPPSESTAPDRAGGARRVAANSLIQFAGEAGSRIATLALYAVMARELGRADFGDFVSATSLALLVTVAAFGVDFTVTRLVARQDAGASQAFWNSLLSKASLGSVLVGLVIGTAVVGGYSDQAVLATAILCAATLVEMFTTSLHAVFRGVERTGAIAQGQLIQRFAVGLAGAGLILAGGSIVGVALIWLAGSFVALGFVTARMRRLPDAPVHRGRPTLAGATGILRDSVGLGISAIFGAALSRLDVIVLGLLDTPETVALYGAAYRVLESTLVVVMVFGLATFPLLARLHQDAPDTMGRMFTRLVKVVLVLTVPIVLALTLLARPFCEILFGSGFAQSAGTLRWLAPSLALIGITSLSSNVLAALGAQRAIVLGLVGGAVTNLVLNLLLIPTYGAEGAAAAMTASMVLTVGVLGAAVLRRTGAPQGLRTLASPLAATGPAIAIGVAIGPGLPATAAAVSAFVVVVVIVERTVCPADARAVGALLRRERPA